VTRLVASDLALAYGATPVTTGLSVEIPDGRITAIIGPNACGKSTLLKALARLLKPQRGVVHLDGQDIHRLPTAEVARLVGLLPQGTVVPPGIAVEDLVARGRYPHQRWYQQWSKRDAEIVARALELTGTHDLRKRPVDQLSGGQRQRVWIALAFAQDVPIMLLDEPTTFLDINHRLEVLDLLAQMNAEEGRTMVVVLHEINEVCRYADHIIAMRDGQIVAQGPPEEVITAAAMAAIFDLRCEVIPDPQTGTPLVIPIRRPLGRAAARAAARERVPTG
jgi:iron complex transport system ATP-binding protein